MQPGLVWVTEKLSNDAGGRAGVDRDWASYRARGDTGNDAAEVLGPETCGGPKTRLGVRVARGTRTCGLGSGMGPRLPAWPLNLPSVEKRLGN